MPVYLYTGSPGSGKTYYVAKNVVLKTIRERRMVITNIRLFTELLNDEERKFYIYLNPLDKDQIDSYRKLIYDHLTKDLESKPKYAPQNAPIFSLPNDYKYPHLDENGQAPVFVLDECHKILSKTAKPSNSLVEFYQEHRHFSEMDIVLVTQGQKRLNETIKDLVEETYYLQKARFKGKGKYHVRMYAGMRDRSTKPQINRTEEYDLSIFSYYKSRTESEREVARAELNKPSMRNKYTTRAAFLGFIGFAVYSVMGYYDLKKPAKKEVQTVEAPATTIEDPFAKNGAAYTEISFDNIKDSVFTNPAQEIALNQTTDYYEFKNQNFRPSLPEREAIDEPKKVEHAPFFNYHISIAAVVEGNNKFLATFKIVHTDNSVSFMQTHREIEKAGYNVTFLNNCLVLLDHPREQNPFYVHCETKDQQQETPKDEKASV